MNNQVKVNSGIIEGVKRLNYRFFFGIPYAKPPVGDLRFKRAQEVEPWKGVLSCKKMGPSPVQMAGGKFEHATRSLNKQSEACLSINVWAPLENQKTKKFEGSKGSSPVFVWFYGGGGHAGESAAAEYDLSSFAKNGIVAVSFNYRLGVLGFYDFSKADPSFDSNCAVSDMILALKWVHDNIGAFGGDPDQVTIAGESAGATGVLAMLAAPSARPLFKQAIVMSGLLSNITGSRTQDINNGKFLRKLGLSVKDIHKLKTMSVEELKPGCAQFFESQDEETPGILSSGPVYDDLIPKSPLKLMQEGELADKKIMFGTCADEGGLFYYMNICPIRWDQIEKMLTLNGKTDLIPAFHRIYDHFSSEKQAIKAINRDRMFWADTMKMAFAQQMHADTYLYRFAYESGVAKVIELGATHSMDVCPALNTRKGHMAVFYKFEPYRKIRNMRQGMHKSFLSFIKTGDPGFEPFDQERGATYVFDRKPHIEKNGVDRERYELWKDIEIFL